jgi:hypothetical protein
MRERTLNPVNAGGGAYLLCIPCVSKCSTDTSFHVGDTPTALPKYGSNA